MPFTNFLRVRTVVCAPVAILIAACAGLPVGNNVIQEKTAATLNLSQDAFTISDRVNEGEKTSYTVATQRGKKYRCHITGAASLTGAGLSNAICSELSTATKPAAR